MGFPIPKPTKQPVIKTLELKDWMSGTVTALDDGRTPIAGLRSSGNVYLTQDGTVKPRPSLTRYAPQPTGTILGQVYPYRSVSGLTFTNKMISLQNHSGTTNVYVCSGGDSSWTAKSISTTFSNTASARFVQINNKILIMNGVNSLAYYDIALDSVVVFTALSNAGGPTVVNNGTTDVTTATTPFTLYYAITANSSVGETAAASNQSRAVNTDRDFWDPTKNSLKITWGAVSNAKSYNVYAGIAAEGAGVPTLYRIASGLSADSTTFIDDGSHPFQIINVAPSFNSTAGPKVSRGEVVNGRVFLVGDADHPYYVWYGGDPGFELDFSPNNGGGFSQIGNGTVELPVAIKPFHQGKGDPGIFVLTDGISGHGKRYVLSANSITYGSDVITFYDVQEDSGTDGTSSPDGVIVYQNNLHYPSTDGFKTTGTLPQIQNVLSTTRESNTIQTDVSSLNTSAMSGCVGVPFEGRLYWALPYASTSNNEIWILDLDRKGAWMRPWNVSASWLWLYEDNSGVTHFMCLSNNVIYEFAKSQFTNDDGTSFPTSGYSGQITFSEDGQVWARLLNVIYTLLRPQGTFTATVQGEGDDPAKVVGSTPFTPSTAQAGWDEPQLAWDSVQRPWDGINKIPLSVNSAIQEVTVEVNTDLKWFSYGWNTSDFGVDYSVSKVVAEYIEIGYRGL